MSINLDQVLDELRQQEQYPEQRLGTCLTQPFTGLNSSNRKIMYSTHDQHKLNLIQGEAPVISTGSENEFLKYSSSYIKAGCDKQVLAKIQKFPARPDLHYWLIVLNLNGEKAGWLDLIERKEYVHTTESFGFALNTNFVDRYQVSDIISQGSIIKCPDVVDNFGNVTFGRNLHTLYLSNLTTTGDGFEISTSAAAKMGTSLYHRVNIQLNDNDIMLNLYGDNDVYKVMPDIGEPIKDGIFLAVRRINNADALFSQTWERLKTIMHPTDTKYVLDGVLLDCEIYSNNWAQIQNGPNAQYNTQIAYYLNNKYRYCEELVAEVDKILAIHPDAKMTYRLQEFLMHAKNTNARYDHYKNYKKYSGTILEFVIKEDLPLRVGDKITNRFGGKGVITHITPTEFMPRVNGVPVDIIMNKSSVNGRLNYGQMFEIEINFRSRKFLEHLKTLDIPIVDKLWQIKEYMDCYSTQLGDYFWQCVLRDGPQEYENTYNDYFLSNTIRLILRPLSDVITIDTLIAVDTKYPWIEQEYLECPIVDSNGRLRYVQSLRRCVVGLEWYIRLKQYAKEKESHTSISSVNIKNENSKSKAGKAHTSAFADTPIKIGFMETEDMTHMDAYKSGMTEITLMLYSSSSEMRNKFFTLYTSDPVHINIELDDSSTSRSAEIFHTLFKELGDELIFEKHYNQQVSAPFTYEFKEPAPFEIKLDESIPAPFEIKFDEDEFPLDDDLKLKEGKLPIVEAVLKDDGSVSNDLSEEEKLIPVAPIQVTIKSKKGGKNRERKAKANTE